MHLLKIAIVVRHDYHGQSGFLQFRQYLMVELATEFRILICGPFVQQQHRAFLQQAHDKRQPLALPSGQIERAEFAVDEARLACKFELP